MNSYLDILDYSAEVKEAFSAKKPIVALESTIITHGKLNKETKQTLKINIYKRHGISNEQTDSSRC